MNTIDRRGFMKKSAQMGMSAVLGGVLLGQRPEGIAYAWEGDLIDLGVEKRLIEKSGSWFSYKGERLGQGRENAKSFLREHDEVAKELALKLRELLGLTKTAPTGTQPKPKS